MAYLSFACIWQSLSGVSLHANARGYQGTFPAVPCQYNSHFKSPHDLFSPWLISLSPARIPAVADDTFLIAYPDLEEHRTELSAQQLYPNKLPLDRLLAVTGAQCIVSKHPEYLYRV